MGTINSIILSRAIVSTDAEPIDRHIRKNRFFWIRGLKRRNLMRTPNVIIIHMKPIPSHRITMFNDCERSKKIELRVKRDIDIWCLVGKNCDRNSSCTMLSTNLILSVLAIYIYIYIYFHSRISQKVDSMLQSEDYFRLIIYYIVYILYSSHQLIIQDVSEL